MRYSFIPLAVLAGSQLILCAPAVHPAAAKSVRALIPTGSGAGTVAIPPTGAGADSNDPDPTTTSDPNADPDSNGMATPPSTPGGEYTGGGSEGGIVGGTQLKGPPATFPGGPDPNLPHVIPNSGALQTGGMDDSGPIQPPTGQPPAPGPPNNAVVGPGGPPIPNSQNYALTPVAGPPVPGTAPPVSPGNAPLSGQPGAAPMPGMPGSGTEGVVYPPAGLDGGGNKNYGSGGQGQGGGNDATGDDSAGFEMGPPGAGTPATGDPPLGNPPTTNPFAKRYVTVDSGEQGSNPEELPGVRIPHLRIGTPATKREAIMQLPDPASSYVLPSVPFSVPTSIPSNPPSNLPLFGDDNIENAQPEGPSGGANMDHPPIDEGVLFRHPPHPPHPLNGTHGDFDIFNSTGAGHPDFIDPEDLTTLNPIVLHPSLDGATDEDVTPGINDENLGILASSVLSLVASATSSAVVGIPTSASGDAV